MRTIVSVQDIVELEIKPDDLLAEYRRLVDGSLREIIARAALAAVDCPGCGSDTSAIAFERAGLEYRECRRCGSLYASPRPDAAQVAAFYRESPAAHFWQTRVHAATAEVRQEKIVEPRVDWVLDSIAEHAPGARRLLQRSADSAVGDQLLRRGLVDAGAGEADVAIAFEALERAVDAPRFVDELRARLRPGGLLFLTTPSASGFEVQTLWNRSATVLPPDKLNVLSVRGLTARFGEPEWEVIELSTPGMFDAMTVARAIRSEPSEPWPRFLRELLQHGDEQQIAGFQEYLQRSRLASFARLVVRRR